MLLHLVVLGASVLMIAVFRLNRAGHPEPEGWPELKAWIRANGGQVSKKLALEDTHHGGFTVRGLVTTARIQESEVVILLPDSLTIRSEHYPEIHGVDLGETCGKLSDVRRLDVKHALAFALEFSKGDESFYAPYIRLLPSLEDFKSYLPQFAPAAVLLGLRAIPVWEAVRKVQEDFDNMQACWEAWKQEPTYPERLLPIPWEAVLLGLLQFQTRAFTHGENSSRLVPLADMMNTGTKSENNVEMDDEREEFVLTSVGDIERGEEVLDPYVGAMSPNRILVPVYGTYVESGLYGVRPLELEECPEPARQFVWDTLAGVGPGGEEVPLCDRKILNMSQGPAHCSLARFTYEYCGKAWGWRSF